MKNLILIVLLVMMSFGATAELLTIKPARPVVTVCFVETDLDDAQVKVLKYSKQGFIVKTQSSVRNRDNWYETMVVMEKY